MRGRDDSSPPSPWLASLRFTSEGGKESSLPRGGGGLGDQKKLVIGAT